MMPGIVYTALLISILCVSIVLFVFSSFGLMFIFGAPWVPTGKALVRDMLRIADLQPGEVVTDLGSGDGRLLITAVKEFQASRGIGHEIHPGLIAWARMRAIAAGTSPKITFRQGDIHKLLIEKTDVVVLYLLGSQMNKLRPKLREELAPETRIVSHGFRFDDITPRKTIKTDKGSVLLYRAGDL